MAGLTDISQETLDSIRGLIKDVHSSGIQRDVTTSLGLVNYDLQRPARDLVPVITPILNMTARTPGNGGTSTHWNQVTALNTALLEMGVPEGGRNIRNTTATSPASADYATLGMEDSITFEADTASNGFEDERAKTVLRLMMAERIGEELVALGGNRAAVALGTPTIGTVTAAHAPGVGNFVNGTSYVVVVVALTLMGARASSLANGVISHVSGTGADGTTAISYGGGSSIPSADGAVTAGSGSADYALTAQCTPVPGAVAYAWYAGTNDSTARLAAITNINSVVIPTIPLTPRQHLSALSGADESKNTTVWDGLLNIAFAHGVVTTLPTGTPGTGTTLTPDGAGSIVEIEQMMKNQWDTTKVSPTHMFLSSQELLSIYQGVLGAGGAPLFRFNLDANVASGEITAGRVIGSFLNKYTADGGTLVKIVLHPNMPPGTILAAAKTLPGVIFPDSNTGDLWEIRERRGLYQIEFPLVTRRYQTGVYVEDVLVHYMPASMSVLTNIAGS